MNWETQDTAPRDGTKIENFFWCKLPPYPLPVYQP